VKEKRHALIVVLAVLQFLLSTGGFYGGYMLLKDTTGKALALPEGLLDKLPISNYLIPALILLVFNGILPLVTVIGLLRKETLVVLNRLNFLPKYYWAYSWTIFNAVFLILWTVGELILWGVNFLSVLYLIWGIITLLLCLVPKANGYYRK
jgi:hypothetical protein